jgi:hypothetical protein
VVAERAAPLAAQMRQKKVIGCRGLMPHARDDDSLHNSLCRENFIEARKQNSSNLDSSVSCNKFYLPVTTKKEDPVRFCRMSEYTHFTRAGRKNTTG